MKQPLREEIKLYADLLKKLGYTRERLVTIGQAIQHPFTASTLAKVHIRNRSGYQYPLSDPTLKKIADVLRNTLRVLKDTVKEDEWKEVEVDLKKHRVDISPIGDHTRLAEEKDMELVKEVVLGLAQFPADREQFIRWSLSQKLELNAKHVEAITPNLNWAESQLDPIIGDMKANKEKTYRYILLSDAGERNRKIIEHFVRAAGKDIAGRLRILPVYRLKGLEMFNGDLFPSPFDIAIYHDTRIPGSNMSRTIAVINHTPVEPKTDEEQQDDKENYDRLLTEYQVRRITPWFSGVWEAMKDKL